MESAGKFETWAFDEVLPSIRETGSYAIPRLSQSELILQIAQVNVKLERRLESVEEAQTAIVEKFDAAIKAFAAPNVDHWKSDMDIKINEMVEIYHRSPSGFRGQLYTELERVANVKLSARMARLKSRMKKQGATYKERQAVTKLDVVSKDKQLRTIFEGIVKQEQARRSAIR